MASNEGSTSHATQSQPQVANLWPVPSAPSYAYKAPETGDLELWKIPDDGDKPAQLAAYLPRPVAKYKRSAGYVYSLALADGDKYTAEAIDLDRGDVFPATEYEVPKRMRGAAAAAIRDYARRTLSVIEVSPSVYRGVPPLAPTLAPEHDDEAAARNAWADLAADYLSPAGRLVVGLALVSPWLRASAGTSCVVSLHGGIGQGKTQAALTALSLFSRVDWTEDGEHAHPLFRTANSAGQGVTSWLQELAYLPAVLDEVQEKTLTDPERQLIGVVTGASRMRGARGGGQNKDRARWAGLLIATSNEPLPAASQMFGRRMIPLQSLSLWQNVPSGDVDAREDYYERARTLATIGAGHPWRAIIEAQYRPGTPDALDLTELAKLYTSPGWSSLGRTMRLAYIGCMLLRDWTGEEAWTTGTWAEAVNVCARRLAETATDEAATASALTQHQAMHPGQWTTETEALNLPPVVTAFKASPLPGCSVEHDGACAWWHIMREPFAQIIPVQPQTLTHTPFRGAMHTPETGELTHKVRWMGMRPRVYTVCMEGAAALDTDREAHDEDAVSDVPRLRAGAPAHVPHVPAPRRDAPTPAPAADPVPQPAALTPAPAATPVAAPAPVRVEVREPDVRAYGWTSEPDVGTALAQAVRDGINDLCGPDDTWTPEAVEAAGWDTGGWTGENGSGWTVHKDGAHVLIRPSENPEAWCASVRDWDEWTGRPVGVTVASMGQRMIREYGDDDNSRASRPRWRLDEEQAEAWTTGGTAHPANWGLSWRERGPGLIGYDRRASHLPSIRQANLAPLHMGERFDTYAEGETLPKIDHKVAGMLRIVVPEWTETRLPSPVGHHQPGEELWVSPELFRAYERRGITPRVLRADLAPTHAVAALHRFHAEIMHRLADGAGPNIDEPGDGARPGRAIAKHLYQSLAGNLMRPLVPGRPRSIYRPDWGWAIRDNSYAMVVRRVWQVADEHGIYPVAVNTDAVYYDQPLPEGALPIGPKPGQFHRDNGGA